MDGKCRYDEVLESLSDGISIQDRDFRIIYQNSTQKKLAGEHVGELCYIAYGEKESICPGCTLALTLADGKTRKHEKPAEKNGRKFFVEITTSPLRDEAGNIYAGIEFVRDVTEHRTLEREKEDFYAMITHDLRSPLTSIVGYTQVIVELYKDKVDEDLLMMIKKIDQSSLMLSSMMEDFMTFSAIEHSRLDIVKTKEFMPELIESVYGEHMLTAANKGITLMRDVGNGVDTARVDRNLIRRAYCNLLQNALKYTRAGGTVTINAEKRLVDGFDSVAVSFSDNGPGIPESERDRIFQKYYRSSSSKGTKGSGLGLAIVKSIAAAHGGRVELESTEGKGSVFTLVIPAEHDNAGA